MKKFIKSRWFPFSVLMFFEVVLLVFLYCNGFRITYAPEMESNWNAISATGTWAGVITAFIACIVAIQIPSKIAKRQDKIALYDKRMECRKAMYSVLDFIEYIEQVEENDNFTFSIQMKYWAVHDVFQYKFLHKLHGDTSIKTLFTTNCLDFDVSAILNSKHLVPGVSKEKSEETAKNLKSYIKCLFQDPINLSKSIKNGTYNTEKNIFLSVKEFCMDTCEILDKLLDV